MVEDVQSVLVPSVFMVDTPKKKAFAAVVTSRVRIISDNWKVCRGFQKVLCQLEVRKVLVDGSAEPPMFVPRPIT